MAQIRHLHASKLAADIPLNPLVRYYAFEDAYKNPRKKYLSHEESPNGKSVSLLIVGYVLIDCATAQ